MRKGINQYAMLTVFSLLISTINHAATTNKNKSMDEQWGQFVQHTNITDPRLQWMIDDKYSMFIHWGLYSQMAGKWQNKTYYGIGEWLMHMANIPTNEYKAYAKNFNPEKFDADTFAKLAKDSGISLIVITAKHHEGFAMFDSAVSDFTITKATSFKRDPLKELALACKKYGIRLGFYYSQNFDWVEPDAAMYKGPKIKGHKRDFKRYFDNKVVPQVTELLTNYGEISQFWFDTPGNMSKKYSQTLVDLVKKHQPNCLLNSRIGNGLGDFSTMGDMHIPLKGHDGVWESIDTTNDSWSYAWYDKHWKSPKKLMQNLVRVIARGGLFKLNIGPKGDGSIPAQVIENMTIAGQWLAKNKKAIYATTASPYHGFPWGDITVKNNKLYLHVFELPKQGKLLLPSLQNSVLSAVMLSGIGKVTFEKENETLILTLPTKLNDDLIHVIEITLDGTPNISSQALAIDGIYPTSLPADFAIVTAAKIEEVRWMEKFGEHKHSQNISQWKNKNAKAQWKNKNAKAQWQVNVLKPGKYTVKIEYASDLAGDGSQWQLQASDDTLSFVTMDTGYRRNLLGSKDDRGRKIKPRMRYQTVELGLLNLTKLGLQNITLIPRVAENKQAVWVKRLIIEPYE
ncbi:alpha-L-fucosidase [Colwellia piezophila]|uniref:alpha-L-fucosidase n=1 Tax=Colwellia piezophila TaxID=211668 RepID=UPI00037102CB|nr:alpha-L-fucosidase [Colwellia piezophila]